MPTVAIPVRALFIIDFPLDDVREGPVTPMSATIELLFSGRSIQSLQRFLAASRASDRGPWRAASNGKTRLGPPPAPETRKLNHKRTLRSQARLGLRHLASAMASVRQWGWSGRAPARQQAKVARQRRQGSESSRIQVRALNSQPPRLLLPEDAVC